MRIIQAPAGWTGFLNFSPSSAPAPGSFSALSNPNLMNLIPEYSASAPVYTGFNLGNTGSSTTPSRAFPAAALPVSTTSGSTPSRRRFSLSSAPTVSRSSPRSTSTLMRYAPWLVGGVVLLAVASAARARR